jgi:hypothetical protein
VTGVTRVETTANRPYEAALSLKRGTMATNSAKTDSMKISTIFSRRAEYDEAKNVINDGVPIHKPNFNMTLYLRRN